MHIDVRVAGEPPWDPDERARQVRDTVQRLVAAGGDEVRTEGNEFCVA